jgi:hypothetical protein
MLVVFFRISEVSGLPLPISSRVLSLGVANQVPRVLWNEQSIFTSRIRVLGVLAALLPFSSEVVSPEVHRSLPRVLISTIIVHFRAPNLHADHPRALK